MTQCHIPYINTKYATTRSNAMGDEIVPRPPARGQLFQLGQSCNRAGRRRGSRNKATLVAPTLLDGEALELTHRAVEAALSGDMLAIKLCLAGAVL